MRVLGFLEMKYRTVIHLILSGLLTFVSFVGFAATRNVSGDECDQTARSRIYSNAYFIKEARDVVGCELALQQPDGISIGALLFVYEGVANKDGISVSGQFSSGKIKMEGDWVEHLIEEHQKKKSSTRTTSR